MEINANGLMKQTITLAFTPDQLPDGIDISDHCAVVIDVLRATTVMTTAGQSGAGRMITCGSIEAAKRLADSLDSGSKGSRPLLCGERKCKPIAGFDLGNSPAEYHPDRVAGRDLILTTTNGTRAVEAVMRSRRLLVCSFLNLTATLRSISTEAKLLIVCAGTEGNVTLEDVLLGGAIVDAMTKSNDTPRINDSASIARVTWRELVGAGDDQQLAQTLATSLGGQNLLAAGYQADLARCGRRDTIAGIVERTDPGKPIFGYFPGT
jgi:2-phosphosulfolactate phosphatase